MIEGVALIIEKDGKFLLVKETAEQVEGLWSLPAGHIDPGETAEEAALREAKEETGYDVEIVGEENEITTTDPITGLPAHGRIFVAKILSEERGKLSLEIRETGWFTKEQIKKLPLRSQLIKKILHIE